MAYAMEACKEANLEFVVFDRPNPVGAVEVEGNLLNPKYSSFVGLYPIVERYGLTIGELAQYFNNEFDIHCNLTVIKMEGYRRNMFFEDTLLPWVFPSPNIPTQDSAFAFLATCYFEGTNLSEGRGTTKPFSLIGSPWLNQELLISKMEKINLPGVKFRIAFFTPWFSKHANTLCKGIELHITDRVKFKPVLTGFTLLTVIRELHPEFEFIAPFPGSKNQMINLLTGDDFIKNNTYNSEQIKDLIERDTLAFTKKKERYHLYE